MPPTGVPSAAPRPAAASSDARAVARLTAVAGVLALAGAFGASAPAALAQTVTSFPTGMLTVTGPDSIVAGTPATYTLTCHEYRTASTSTAIQVDGSMPLTVTAQRFTNCARVLGGNQNPSFFCGLPNLAPETSESMTVTFVAQTAGVQTVSLGALLIAPDLPDPTAIVPNGDVLAESAFLPINVLPAPTDIQVTGSSNNGSPPRGSQFLYTFQVKDNGPFGASNVTFDDTLPAGIELAGLPGSSGAGPCTADTASSSIHCDIGDLAVGQQAVITVPAIATGTGTFANTATIGMDGPDSHPDNNSVTVTVQPR